MNENKEEEKIDSDDTEWVILSGNNIVAIFPYYEEAFSYILKIKSPNLRILRSEVGKGHESFKKYKQIKKVF